MVITSNGVIKIIDLQTAIKKQHFEGIMKRIKYYDKNISYTDFSYYDNVVIKIKARDTKVINYDKSKRNIEQNKDKFYDYKEIKINRTELSQKLNIVIDNASADTITKIITEQINQLKIMVFPSPKKKKLYEKDYAKDRPMKGYNDKEIVIDIEQVKKDTEALIDLFNTDNINDKDYNFFKALKNRNQRKRALRKKKSKSIREIIKGKTAPSKSKHQKRLFSKLLKKRFYSNKPKVIIKVSAKERLEKWLK